MLESPSKTRPARTLPQIDHYLYKYASRRARNTPWPLTHSTMTQHGTPRAPLLVMGRKRLPPCFADRRSEIAVRSFFSFPSSCSLSPPTCRSHRSSLPSREVHISRPSTCARPSPLRVNFYHSIFVPRIGKWRTDEDRRGTSIVRTTTFIAGSIEINNSKTIRRFGLLESHSICLRASFA